jgi:hypothetical protein
MVDSGQSVPTLAAVESVVTFGWRDLRLHVVTREPLSGEQLHTIERMVRRVPSVGVFADLLGMVLGRHVRIRTQRPSPDVRLEVGS